MDSKKDPGKFTVRFNIADPQQRAAAEMLNRQGRCKAQFITNAVLFYTGAAFGGQAFSPLDNLIAQHKKIDAPAKASQKIPPVAEGELPLENFELDSIRKTMEAFQSP